MGIQLKTAVPGPRSQALMQERLRHVPRGPFHTAPVFVQKSQGSYLEDVDGNTLLDFASGIGVTNVGHCHEHIRASVEHQVAQYMHLGFNVTPYEPYVRLCEKLNRMTPGSYVKKTFLANSGAEAVENAIKIARAYTKRQAVICFDHAFHGRTYMAMSLTSKAKPYKAGFAPFNTEVYRAPFPYSYRWPSTDDPSRVAKECLEQVRDLIQTRLGAQEVAAVIIEPVLGEGGFLPAGAEFMQGLQALCRSHGVVFIADEIQTGFGRTGTLFASEQFGVEPDLLISAKGLGGGMPISAVTGRAEIMDAPGEGGIGGTFGGSPVSCAAALAVFDLFEDGKLLANAQNMGEQLNERLQAWKKKFSIVGDARGLGPMRAIELVKDCSTKEPNAEAAKALISYCYQNGVVLMNAGSYGNVIRFLVPLTITKSELDEGLNVIERGLERIG